MRLFLILCAVLAVAGPVAAQVPADTARIHAIPVPGIPDRTFQTVGLQPGDVAPDITLYDLAGRAYTLSHLLATGKPVMLVSASYTCPVFRGNIEKINALAARLADSAHVLVVYVVEAHPAHNEPCPYIGQPWVTDENQTDGILYRQPTTYAERRALAVAQQAAMPLVCPIVLDTPENAFWLTYGQAPNSAWWVGTDGRIAARQGWVFPFQ